MADQGEPQLNPLLADDKNTTHVTIKGDGKLLAGIMLTAEQLDQTIVGLLADHSRRYVSAIPDQDQASRQKSGPPYQGRPFRFGVDECSRELIFSLRDPSLGLLSQRFGGPLLERMLKLARSLESRMVMPRSATNQQGRLGHFSFAAEC
ncbi:MAG: hypothetical protein JWM91_2574 [Rhodospirillales bacterium]|nr:hypothetical protein [Rhodospirillales bacterium]